MFVFFGDTLASSDILCDVRSGSSTFLTDQSTISLLNL